MRSVIVTGGTGFIGSNLSKELRNRFGPDCRIHALGSEVDLSNRTETFEWFEKIHWAEECDHILHLAALYKAGDWPVRHPATQFFVNMSINVNVLEAWKRYFPHAKMTSVLSYCIYPSHSDPHPEEEAYGTEPEEYLFAYALTKKAQLIGQRAYLEEHGLSAASVVLPTVYGPGDSFAENSHVMGALVGKFVRAAHQGLETVEVWGSGRQQREFLFVEDAADGIIQAALGQTSPLINLGHGHTNSIREIAEIISDCAGFEGEIVHNENRFVGVDTRLLDVSRAKDELHWTAATSIRSGIQKTVDWYRSQLQIQTASSTSRCDKS
ncbi:MAG: NAD-dependent epimerase/dehydratase family protein [Pseudomonadota bacterium]